MSRQLIGSYGLLEERITIRTKLWLGLSTAALISGGTATAAQEPLISSHDLALRDSRPALPEGGPTTKVQLADSQGGEGGEGGEAGATLSNDDAAYLTQLALIRGHLSVGMDLYRQGAQEAAVSHMKHPEDEIYQGLEPALAARGVKGFEEELEAMADLAKADAPVGEVEAAHQDLLHAIDHAAQGAAEAGAATTFKVIVGLIRTAAEEYEAVVKDGKVVNAYEYQDALGFVRVADELAAELDPAGRPEVGDALAVVKTQLETIGPAWPSVVPPDQVATDPSLIYGATARVEIAALRVE